MRIVSRQATLRMRRLRGGRPRAGSAPPFSRTHQSRQRSDSPQSKSKWQARTGFEQVGVLKMGQPRVTPIDLELRAATPSAARDVLRW